MPVSTYNPFLHTSFQIFAVHKLSNVITLIFMEMLYKLHDDHIKTGLLYMLCK